MQVRGWVAKRWGKKGWTRRGQGGGRGMRMLVKVKISTTDLVLNNCFETNTSYIKNMIQVNKNKSKFINSVM